MPPAPVTCLTLFHSTRERFERFEVTRDIGFHFGTLEQALARARVKNNRHVLAAQVDIRNPLDMPDLGDWDLCRLTLDGLERGCRILPDGSLVPAFDEAEIERVANSLAELPDDTQAYEWFRSYLEAKGFDGIRYRNVGETPGETEGDHSYIAFRPEQVLAIEYLGITLPAAESTPEAPAP